VISASCVIHLWPKLGSGRPGPTSAMAGRICTAALAGTRALGCSGGRVWAQRFLCVCAVLTQVETRPVQGCVMLQRTCHGGAVVAEHRRRCSGHWNSLWVLGSSSIGREVLLVLTEGLFRAELQHRCVDSEVGRRLSVLSSGTGHCGGSRDSWA
jgi:hypothetical protein